MLKPWMLVVVLAFARLLGGCGDDGAQPTADACVGLTCGGGSSAKELTTFSFLDATNPALTADVIASINGSDVAATVPAGTDVTALVATFSTTGSTISVGGVVQESGVAARNFTSPVIYIVTAEDGTTAAYTVTVTVAGATAKDITAFSFTDAANTALTADVTATISGTSIAATVPATTDVTALVATFTTTGASVKVAFTTQVSGTTANNFTSPVMYVVTAADNSTKMYTVTVTKALATAKDITAFSFLDVANPALSADVTATINGTAIAATVPAGTDVTALVATFTSTGVGVDIAGAPQTSGSSANNFTSPVMYTVTAADNSTKIYTVTVTVAPSTAKAITAFAFLDAPNAALSADVTATINGQAITATVPAGTNVSALIATFTTTGMSVRVGATTQSSGITPNDFTNPVMYVVTAGDGSMQTYTVTVTVAASTAKDITAFSFLDAPNAALSADVTATINGTAIAATVPMGTNVSALIATFATNGMSVRVGATTQASGVTANDFTSPVMYVVTAGDGSMQTYTVTVTVAASAAKDLTAFSFLDAPNAALSADVTATIDQGTGAIAATVPAGTNVTALIATFTTTGMTVRVGGTTQASGITANDFTSPVTYVVTAGDTTTKTYTVTVTVAPSAAKDITAFSFTDAANSALTVDVTATIDQGTGAIAATVPAGTVVTGLIATFTTTGASVRVGATTQATGVTANDFTNPVMYVVTAADNSTKTYTVTVTVTGAIPNCGAAPYAKLEPLGSLIAVMGGSTSPVTVSANICTATTVVMNVGETKSMNVTKGVPFFLTGSQVGSMPSFGPEYNLPVALMSSLPAGVIMYTDGVGVGVNPAWDPTTMAFIHLGSPQIRSGGTPPCTTVDGITYAVTGHPEAVIQYVGNGSTTNTEGTAFLTIVTTGTPASPEYVTITATKPGCTLGPTPVGALITTGRTPVAPGRSSAHAGFQIRN